MMRRLSRCHAASVSNGLATAMRSAFDGDGYELPFGRSKADRMREEMRQTQQQAGVKVVFKNRRAPQWHPSSLKQLQYIQSQRTIGGGGDEERIRQLETDLSDAEETFEQQFISSAPHDVELRRARMANMRLLLEGVPLVEPPKDPFNGFFKKRDGTTPAEPNQPLVTAEEVEEMLQELSHMQFPPEDEEEVHVRGCEEYYGVGDLGHAEDGSVTISEGKAPMRRMMTQERGLRAPYVTDEIERKLLITLCLQTLTMRLSTNDRQRQLKDRSTTIDRNGRSPPVKTDDAKQSPQLYMKYGLDDNGTDLAFRILEHILEVEAEQHYEAIRYHAELAVISGQLWRLQDTFRLAKGFTEADRITPRGDRAPEVRESSQAVCEEIITSTVSEYLLRHVVEQIVDGEGEGSAAKVLLDQLRDLCYICGHRASRLLLETVVDDVESAITMALEKRESRAAYVATTLSPTQAALKGGLSEIDKQVLLLLQGSTAMLKTLVGTELPLVVDPAGVLHFNCQAKLYITLREQKRIHESWGVAENLLKFHDRYKEILGRDYQEQVKQFEAQVKEDYGVDVNVAPRPVQEADLLHAVPPEDGGVRLQVGDAPDYENPYSELMRKIWIEYCSDRAMESPTFGKKLITRTIEERYPASNELYRLLSACYFKLGDKTKAMEAANRAVELNPCDPHGHMLMAALLWDCGKFLEARREQRLADVVHTLIFDGKPVTAEDLRLAHVALTTLDSNRADALRRAEEEDRDLDGQSHKFNYKDRESSVDAVVVPEAEYHAALLPPLAGAIVRDLSVVRDDPGDQEYKEWMAKMAQSHRYSKFFVVPRVEFKHLLDTEREKNDGGVWTKPAFITEDMLEKIPPVLY